jgi:hypothetical protein
MKKLLLSIVTLALILVIANFALWFFNTNTITKSLEQLKNTLAQDDLTLDYKEIRFDSFKSWRIDGVIEEPSLKTKLLGNNLALSTPRINFISKPFSDELTISMPGDHLAYQFAGKFLNLDTDAKLQFDPNLTPEIVINFNSSLSELVHLLKEDGKNIYMTMKSISFDASNISLVDSKTNQVEKTTEKVYFDLKFLRPKDKQLEIDSDARVLNTGFDANFLENAPDELRTLYKFFASYGKSSYSHSINILFKDPEGKISNEFRLDVKELLVGNDVFKFEGKGYIELRKEDRIPAVDFTLVIRNYVAFFDFYKEYFKLASLDAGAHSNFNSEFLENNLKVSKEIMSRFATANGKDAELVFVIQDGQFKVSGKTFAEVMEILQPLFAQKQDQTKTQEKNNPSHLLKDKPKKSEEDSNKRLNAPKQPLHPALLEPQPKVS